MNEINIENVTKTYGDVTSLDGVSLTIPSGSTFGLLGTNGAGKTTLFRLLVGHEHPDTGTLEVAGRSPDEGASIRQRVGYLPENAGFPASFTGREVLSFHADMRGVSSAVKDDRIADALETVGLSEAADRRVGGYSNGMNRRLGLATVLVAEPRVLLLDEPFSGLDPMGVDALNGVIARLSTETSMTIVLTSHTLVEAGRVCDRIAILDDGCVRVSGAADDLRRATGYTVTVRFRAVDEDALSRVADRFVESPNVRAVDRTDDGWLRVRCARDEVLDVITAAHDGTDVDGFEVHEPDLYDVFHDAVGSDAGMETAPPPAAGRQERGG
ncbi:ABC transporter ATP-binding protein [Haloplanus aerogenes]|uniref:ABC transporter ATP-binding protein n=1 Tax=Haloplanus aerogenes TaxID=660522 RepID=A0A3M0CRV8_9EURY|nr:ABC transporter ATP-binding protein [Haloplanus aerogenes]RMB11655.1 Cu-processing system ATP-binding protein [Haloplanus aerogenes]